MPRILSLALAIVLIGCTDIGSVPTPSATPTLLPRRQATASATVEHEIGIAPVDTVGPSPTPLKHVIVEGDTLLSVAVRYGVELAELLLANPGVNPRLLVIGESLSIPRSGAQGPVPSATPVPVDLSQVACYEAIPAGLTCLLTAAVSGDSAVEGVVALVTLADSTGQALQTEPAYGPMNLVLPGSRLPLAATFGQPDPRFSFASAVPISALNASEIGSRYVELDLQIESSLIASDAQSARATGTVELKGELLDRPVGLRLVVLALGENELPVGFRTWEAPEGGFSFGFDITVFSLGPPIKSVEILSEAPYLP